jgi:glucose-6-phosphate isomerase
VFGLWVEQLIAESLGKDDRGILPNIEIDPLLIADQHATKSGARDRCVIAFHFDDTDSTARATETLAAQLPVLQLTLSDPLDLGAQFVIWEYATALLAHLMSVNPFNQPNVAETKRAVDFVLSGTLLLPPALSLENGMTVDYSPTVGEGVSPPHNAFEALQMLFGSFAPGDYFALLSFVPFTGTRRASLEQMRSCVARAFGVASCLEIGPRYLHSTGQLYKGGPNNGIFLIISADDPVDLEIETSNGSAGQERPSVLGAGTAKTLGTLLRAQARGDLAALSNHHRRALHVHLPNWDESTLEALAATVCRAAETQAK